MRPRWVPDQEPDQEPGAAPAPSGPQVQDTEAIEKGLMHVHNLLHEQRDRLNRVSAHLYALTGLLLRAGLVRQEELEAERAQTHEEMMARQPARWIGARLDATAVDKYQPEHEVSIDCAQRLHLCHAACCTFGLLLSEQDLQEGIVRWDLARPYHIKQRADGYCVHCHETERTCQVHEARPLPCRRYDCRDDPRIWLDFARRIPSPALTDQKSRKITSR